MEEKVITEQSGVLVSYKGTLDDGTVFDESKEPLHFHLGNNQVIPGFEKALIGMKVGEEKDISLEPEEAYGQPNPALIQEIPKNQFKDMVPEVGMTIGVTVPQLPQPIPAKIVEVKENTVVLDLNHPLAGKRLHFHLKVEAIEDEHQH